MTSDADVLSFVSRPRGRPRTTDDDAVLAFVVQYLADHGYSPTVREIGDALGVKSTHSTHLALRRLRETGKVTWVERQPRTLRVVTERPQRPSERRPSTKWWQR